MTNEMQDSGWRRIHPEGWAPPIGYANAVESEGGRRLTIAGQTAMDGSGAIVHAGDLVAQAHRAFANVVTDVEAYRRATKAIGAAYREHLGRWFPAMTLVEVSRLYDVGAMIEVDAEAVVPGVREA